jgi:hypothetical protein
MRQGRCTHSDDTYGWSVILHYWLYVRQCRCLRQLLVQSSKVALLEWMG